MKLVTTKPAVNEKYDTEVLRGLWVGSLLWEGVLAGVLPQPQVPVPF